MLGVPNPSTSFELFTGSTPPKADANGTVEVLKNSMTLTGFAPSPTVTLRLNTMADISAVPHLEAHHSYLWLQIRATLEDDTEHTCDVQTIGLDYLG